MTDYGILVAKKNKSAIPPVLLDDSINNKYPFLKAFKQGVAAVNVTGPGTFTADITHGLGYYPFFIYLGSPDPNNPTRRYLGNFGATGPHGSIGMDSYITKEILKLGWTDTSASPGSFRTYPYTVTFYYYIFYDKLQ